MKRRSRRGEIEPEERGSWHVRFPDDLLGVPVPLRRQPQPAPPAGPFEQPLICLAVNEAWSAHLAGFIDGLAWPDQWAGDDIERQRATDAIEAILAAMRRSTCDGGEMAILDIRIHACLLQIQYAAMPGAWVTVGNIRDCSGGQTPEPVWEGTSLAWDLNDDGAPDTPFVDLAGADGAPGADGVCDCDGPTIEQVPEPSIPEAGPDKICNIASYFADIILPGMVEAAMQEKEKTNDQVGLGLNLGVIGLAVGFTIATGGAAAPLWMSLIPLGASGSTELAEALMFVDVADIRASLAPSFWDEVRCIIYENLPDTGVIGNLLQDEIGELIGDIGTNNNAGEIVESVFRGFTREALDKICLAGVNHSGNCDLCAPPADWTHYMLSEFAPLPDGMYILGPTGGSYDPVSNVVQATQISAGTWGLELTVNLPDTIVTGVAWDITKSGSTGRVIFKLYHEGVQVAGFSELRAAGTYHDEITYSGPVDTIYCVVQSNRSATSAITYLRVSGIGPNPF